MMVQHMLFSAHQVAKMLGIAPSSLARKLKHGDFTGAKRLNKGGATRWLIPSGSVLKYFQTRGLEMPEALQEECSGQLSIRCLLDEAEQALNQACLTACTVRSEISASLPASNLSNRLQDTSLRGVSKRILQKTNELNELLRAIAFDTVGLNRPGTAREIDAAHSTEPERSQM